MPDDVSEVFESHSALSLQRPLELRQLILDTASATEGVGEVEEGPRWGESSDLTPETKRGSTIRLGGVRGRDDAAMLNRFLSLIAAVLLLPACAGPSPTASDPPPVVDGRAAVRLDSTLNHFVSAGTIAGASALIYEDGEEVYYNDFGMADREGEVPMDRQTLVQIFSMTKPITGVALMQLYERDLFDLDDPLADYLPEFADVQVYAGEDASGDPILESPERPITIRDITRHTAGFATGGEPGIADLLQAADPMNRSNTLAQMSEKLADVPLAFHPGAQWAYGPSVDVQARLVEVLSGRPFDEYLQENIFNPLGMAETRYVVPEADRPRLAASYRRSEDGVLSRVPDDESFAFNTQAWPLTPGGYGLTASIDDYMRFARMLLGQGELDGVRILQPETVRLMATSHLDDSVTERSWLPSKGQVGFGIDFAVRTRPPASADENPGVVGEFFWDGAASTLFWIDPTNDLAAVLFVQLFPFDPVGLHRSFREAVYGPHAPAAAS